MGPWIKWRCWAVAQAILFASTARVHILCRKSLTDFYFFHRFVQYSFMTFLSFSLLHKAVCEFEVHPFAETSSASLKTVGRSVQ